MIKKYIISIFLIFTLVIQGGLLIKDNKKSNVIGKDIRDISVEKDKEDKSINSVLSYFKNIEGVVINSIVNDEDIKINLDFNGNSKSVKGFIDKIEEFTVVNYNLKYKNEDFYINLDIKENKNKEKI